MLRGLEKVKGEWNLVCIAYNLQENTVPIRQDKEAEESLL